MSANPGHPWCSDQECRFAFLTEKIQALYANTHVSCVPFEGADAFVHITPNYKFADATSMKTLVTSFLRNPEQFLTSLPEVSELEKSKEILLSELKNQDESRLHQSTSVLLQAICSTESESRLLPSLLFLCTLTVQSYVDKIARPLPQDIANHIVNLSRIPTCKDYLFQLLLPSLLLSPGHLQSQFALDILQPSDCLSRTSLLCSLCRSKTAWPSESYSVLRFLLSNTGDISTICPLIVQAFHHQLSLNTGLNKSVQFAGLLMLLLRNPHVKILGDSWTLINRIGQQNETFLRSALCSLIRTFRSDCDSASGSPTI